MNTYEVLCDNAYVVVNADKGYVDHIGTLRFYNVKDKHALAQFATGHWKRYKRLKSDVGQD